MADMTMGQRIAEERKKLGISQEALGEKMGVSRQAISKWEADGAVPEIDKLIALSKLFGVSVGWLLGVEETPVPVENQTDTLSDAQLYQVEELVKKYQPKPRKLTYPWALLICLVLILTTYIYRLQSSISTMDYAYDSLYTQFSELRSRVQKLEDTQTNPNALSLFGDYNFEILGVTASESAITEAEIRIFALPNIWQEGDSAYLTITREGMDSFSMDCTWNGAWLFATIPLEIADGYDFCMTIVHPDGTQEQQVLNDYDIQNLKSTLSITAQATSGKWSYENNILSLNNYEFQVTMPRSGKFYGGLSWESVDLILTTGSGAELGRFSLLTALDEDDAEILSSPEIWLERAEIRFVDLDIPKNEGVLLWLSAETSNGLSAMEPVTAWATDETGKLRKQ